jgi:hypothetical protein
MARLVDKQKGETVYTLDLTEKEVATLTAALRVTDYNARKSTEVVKRFGQLDDDFLLYQFLRDDVLGVFD